MIYSSPIFKLGRKLGVQLQYSTAAFVMGLAVSREFGTYLFVAAGPFVAVFDWSKPL